MLPVIVNKECTIIGGAFQGFSGKVISFNYLENEVFVEIDKEMKIVTCHENIQQEH